MQNCHFYESPTSSDALLIMLPELSSRSTEAIPFYHPQVAGIAFRYCRPVDHDESGDLHGILQLDYMALEAPKLESRLPGQPYWTEDSRTYRTALQLLSLIARHGKSRLAETSYVKRVHHDTMVPKVMFQDLYANLKKKYIWILKEWKEVTDPAKHVFEVSSLTTLLFEDVLTTFGLQDVAIATFLISLWKLMYQNSNGHPPGGFVDVGCGNGLL